MQHGEYNKLSMLNLRMQFCRGGGDESILSRVRLKSYEPFYLCLRIELAALFRFIQCSVCFTTKTGKTCEVHGGRFLMIGENVV